MLDFRKTWPTHHKLRLLEDQVRLCPYNWRRLTQTTPSPQQRKLLQKLHFLRRLKLTSGYATAFIPRPKGFSTPGCLPESALLPHPSNNRLIETLTNAQTLYPNDRLAVLYCSWRTHLTPVVVISLKARHYSQLNQLFLLYCTFSNVIYMLHKCFAYFIFSSWFMDYIFILHSYL